MAQGVLPYKYKEERSSTGMTALAGLPIYLDLASVLGDGNCIRAHVQVRKSGQGWNDEQVVLSLMLLNLAGGDCVDDIRILEKDEGFCKVLGRVQPRFFWACNRFSRGNLGNSTVFRHGRRKRVE